MSVSVSVSVSVSPSTSTSTSTSMSMSMSMSMVAVVVVVEEEEASRLAEQKAARAVSDGGPVAWGFFGSAGFLVLLALSVFA